MLLALDTSLPVDTTVVATFHSECDKPRGTMVIKVAKFSYYNKYIMAVYLSQAVDPKSAGFFVRGTCPPVPRHPADEDICRAQRQVAHCKLRATWAAVFPLDLLSEARYIAPSFSGVATVRRIHPRNLTLQRIIVCTCPLSN